MRPAYSSMTSSQLTASATTLLPKKVTFPEDLESGLRRRNLGDGVQATVGRNPLGLPLLALTEQHGDPGRQRLCSSCQPASKAWVGETGPAHVVTLTDQGRGISERHSEKGVEKRI